MSQNVPGVHHDGTKDESLNFDAFNLSEEDEARLEEKANHFVDSQEDVAAVNDCGDACKI